MSKSSGSVAARELHFVFSQPHLQVALPGLDHNGKRTVQTFFNGGQFCSTLPFDSREAMALKAHIEKAKTRGLACNVKLVAKAPDENVLAVCYAADGSPDPNAFGRMFERMKEVDG